MFPHLEESAPRGASKLGVRLIYNNALDILFVGCVKTPQCIHEVAHYSDTCDKYVYKCGTCLDEVIVRVYGLGSSLLSPTNGRPLDRWVAGWLGYDTDDVHVYVYK